MPDYASMTVAQLKAEAMRRNLPVHGLRLKRDYIAALEEHDNSRPHQAEDNGGPSMRPRVGTYPGTPGRWPTPSSSEDGENRDERDGPTDGEFRPVAA